MEVKIKFSIVFKIYYFLLHSLDLCWIWADINILQYPTPPTLYYPLPQPTLHFPPYPYQIYPPLPLQSCPFT